MPARRLSAVLFPLALAAAPFLLIGFAGNRGARLQWVLRAVAAIAAAAWIGPPETLTLGAGRTIELGLIAAVAGAALWVFLLASAANAMDRAGGPALSCCAIGLLALAGVAVAASAPGLALAALIGAGVAAALGAWRARHARAGAPLALFIGAYAALLCIAAMREIGLSPFAPPSLFLPLLVDALLTFARRREGAPLVFEIGVRSGLKRAHVAWAFWLASTHCALIGAVVAEAGRRAAIADPSTFDELGAKLNFIASLAPLIAFVVLVLLMFRLSSNVRRYAASQ